jgi:hypothetical protein
MNHPASRKCAELCCVFDIASSGRVNTVRRKSRMTLFMLALCCATVTAALMAATPAQAQSYTRLLVLLPGEIFAPGTPSGKTGAPAAQTTGVAFTVRVLACDASYNLVTSITHVVSLSSTDESATLPPNTQLFGGQAELAVTMNAVGSFTVTAADESDPTMPDATSSYVTVMALYGFFFSEIAQKHTAAGVPENYTLTAVDPTGQRVMGFNGVVRLKELTSYGEGRIEPDAITLVDGFWEGDLAMFRADETSINRGNVNIYAYLESNPSKNGTSDPLIVHPGVFARVQIVVPGQDPLPGSITGLIGSPATQGAGQSFICDVYATDEYWNVVASADEVLITSTDPAASTPVTGKMNTGYTQVSLSLGTVGAQTLTITDITAGFIMGMTTAPIQVIPAAPDHFEIDQIASPQVAGVPVEVTIRATDMNSNTITDFFGDAILAANTGAGSISPQAIAFTGGVWTGDMIFKGAGGAVSFTCSDFSAPPHTGTSNTFQVLPGPFVGLQVLLPGQTAMGGTVAGYVGEPTSHNAGSSFTVNVRAVDVFWNRVPTINDRISLSSTDEFAAMPAETTLANGEITFPTILYKGGFQTITVADVDSTLKAPHTSRPVEIISGPYARILLLAPGEEVAPGTETGRTGEATDQSINYAFTVTVFATDSWWNPVTGVADQIRITSNDPLAELPPDTYMTDGMAQMSVRLSTGGYQQITATNLSQPAMPASTTQVRAITSGFHLEAEVSPSTVQAGEPFTLTVKVTNDAGSVIQEINSFVNIDVRNASTQEPGRGTLLITRFQLLQGERSITETYTFAEPIILIATDDLDNAPAATDVITVTPGVPTKIDLTSNPSWVGGNKHATVSATVVDDFDNGVPGREVYFALVSGGGTLTPLDTLTDDGGTVRADFLSSRIPGISVVRASSGELISELEIETALVDPNAPGGYITNYPNPFHPGDNPTTIAYKLSDDANVTLRIYTLSGTLVLREDFPRGGSGGSVGLNEVEWDGRNGTGDYVASGGYIVVVEAEGKGETLHVMRRKVAVVR